jgi:hypothetical protein
VVATPPLFLKKMYKEQNLHINHFVTFHNGIVKVDGEKVHEIKNDENFVQLGKRIFKSLENSYSKFHKMDRISKLAYLSCELLIQKVTINQYNPENVATVFSNSSSTIDTDTKFQNSIRNIPSPAIFVYTLPNIMVGEICIRFGFKGENVFFIEPEFNPSLLTVNIKNLFQNSSTELCIAGWVDYYGLENYNCFMAVISKDDSGSKLTPESLNSHFKL